MNRNGSYCHNRNRYVPGWFMDVLHELIFANVMDAYMVIRMMNGVRKGIFLRDNALAMLYAQGYNYDKIAERLGISRFAVSRRIDGLCKIPGFEEFAKVRKIKGIAGAIRLFAERYRPDAENVVSVIDRLAPLSAVELGVLFAIVRELPKSAVLENLSISRSGYHKIKSLLFQTFSLEWCCSYHLQHKRTYRLRDTDGAINCEY